MSIAICRLWDRQPQSLTKFGKQFGFKFGWLGSAPFVDLVTRRPFSRASGIVDVVGVAGRGVTIAPNATTAISTPAGVNATHQMITFCCVFSWQSGSQNFPQLIGDSTENVGFRLGASGAGGGTLGIVKGGVATLSTISLTSGVIYVLAASHRIDTGEAYIIARPIAGGTLLRASDTNTSAANYSNNTWSVGSARADFTGSWRGDVFFAAGGHFFLPEQVAANFLDSPWSVFEPRRIFVPVSAGGGATDLTAAEASHAHSADNVVLTSSTSLSIADALHAHAADNVVLTSATAITIADALHAHAADNVVLTSATAITIADALHAHAADNVVLTSATAITIADALHAHAADNVVLEVSGTTNLTIADALHAHAADNLVLTSQIAIVVADALHAHTADGLTLTAASVLALQDALHAHAADNLTLELSGGITLTLADALHAHTADGVLLTVSAYLVVSDALHAHAADNILLSIPGAFRAGNPRVWILDSRQRYSMVDSRRRVVHLN